MRNSLRLYTFQCSFVIIFCLCHFSLFTQQITQQLDTTKPSLLRFGIGAQVLFGVHTSQFRSLVLTDKNKESCCSNNYDVLPNVGFSVNALAELPLFERGGIALRLGLSGLSTGFRSQDSIPVAAPNGLGVLTGSLTYSLQTALLWLDIEPFFTIRPVNFLSLYAGVGGKLTLSSLYQQREDFVLSNTASNSTGTPISSQRNISEGAISGVASFLPTIGIGASYELPLGEQGNVLLAPEFFATLPLGSLIAPNFLKAREGTNTNAQGFWTMFALRGGVSVRFSPERTTPRTEGEGADILRQQNFVKDSIEKEQKHYQDSLVAAKNKESEFLKNEIETKKSAIELSITRVQGIQENAEKIDNPTLQVEERAASRSRYILNNIFFDVASADIPIRYHRIQPDEREEFRLEKLADLSVLQIYYEVLNILGKRMNAHPKAILTLIGFSDGLREKNDKKLAELRTNTVCRYLEDVWQIEPSRLKTKTGVVRIPSGTDGDEVLEAEEQRRVEIQCDVPEVMEEMRFDYIMQEISPPKMRIESRISSSVPLQYWKVEFLQKSPKNAAAYSILYARQDTTQGENVCVWDIRAPENVEAVSQLHFTEPILVQLRAKTLNNDSAESTMLTVPVVLRSVDVKRQQNLPDERVDSYTLFSFAYGTNAPLSGNAEAQRIISQIKRTLKAGAKVVITGYSDSRGNPMTNNLLSFQRAKSVAASIGFANAEVSGVGVTTLNDNRLPEGRFYNRFVQVDVRTPLR